MKKFIIVTEGTRTVFRFKDDIKQTTLQKIGEIMAMEILRGHKSNKTISIKNAIDFYHEALKRGIVSNDQTIHQISAREDEHPVEPDSDLGRGPDGVCAIDFPGDERREPE